MKRQNPKNKNKFVVGVTGSFGSGKTTVSGLLAGFGAKVIDADKIARGYLFRKSPVYGKITRVFGNEITGNSGAINRVKLAEVVFCDRRKLSKLNSIIHPLVIRDIREGIKSSSEDIVVLDVALLIEAGLTGLVNKVIVVKAKRSQQVKRVQSKSSLSKEDILRRIRSQLPLSRKLGFADFIIDNSGSVNKTRKQVARVWKDLRLFLRGYKGGSCGEA